MSKNIIDEPDERTMVALILLHALLSGTRYGGETYSKVVSDAFEIADAFLANLRQ